MNELKIFEKVEFGSVRVVMKDGEPWFVASDVAKELGYEKNCFENHISELFVEFKETLGLDLSTYDPTDLNAFMSQNSLLYISNFGLELLFEYLYDRDYQHLKLIVDKIDIGYVYIIDDIDNNKRKIGKTKHPNIRISSVCSSAGVKNKKVFISERVINYFILEKFLKEKFIDKNIHGEWFKSSFDEIVTVLKQKEVRISPVLEKLKIVFTDNSSAAFLEYAQHFLGWKK